jgi:hypothetical protein
MLSYLSGPFSVSFWHFLTLKASHARKNEWLYKETLTVTSSGCSLSIGTSIDLIGVFFPEIWSTRTKKGFKSKHFYRCHQNLSPIEHFKVQNRSKSTFFFLLNTSAFKQVTQINGSKLTHFGPNLTFDFTPRQTSKALQLRMSQTPL